MDSQKEGQDNLDLHKVIKLDATTSTITTKNKAKSWKYGYNEKYDVVIISKLISTYRKFTQKTSSFKICWLEYPET